MNAHPISIKPRTRSPLIRVPVCELVYVSSLEIAELLEKRHDKVKQSADRLANKGVIQRPPMGKVTNHLGQTVEIYRIGERDSYVIVAQLSPEFTARLVDYWQTHKADQPRLPTTAEGFAHAFQMLADQERRHAQHDAAISAISDKVERIEHAQTVMSSRPANSEGITHLRERIHGMFGLSAETIDEVMRQSPYSPKPAGTVKNLHESADGSTYTIWWKKDVTATFHRFIEECIQVTRTRCIHPYIEGRFKLIKDAAR